MTTIALPIDLMWPVGAYCGIEHAYREGERTVTDASGHAGDASGLMDIATEVVAAFVGNNSLPVSELPGLIAQVHAALVGLSRTGSITNTAPPLPASPATPAVPIKKSITDDYLVCLEDGHRFKSLKRHLRTDHGLSPESYREKWRLPSDYPMVASGYAKVRSELAKKSGLGQQRRGRKK
jgi:predicted transcriptional regulator